MNQDSTLSPNPIVLFASFLLFLSYIYNKVTQSQDKSSQEGKYNEKYVLEDHYLKNGPQVYSSQAQRIPNTEFNGHVFTRNIRSGPQGVSPLNDGSPIPEGWPSREPDLSLLENLSAIHNPTKTRLVDSPDNSFDIPFPTNKFNKEDFGGDLSLSLDIPMREETFKTQPKTTKQFYQANYMKTGGPDGVEQRTTTVKKTTTVHRGPVYHDSSDSEVDPKEFSKGQQKYNKKPQVVSAKSEPLETINEEINLNDKRKAVNETSDNINGNTTRHRLNETNFEPGVEKRRQIGPIGAAGPNNKNKVIAENTIKVQEIFNPSSHHSSKSKSGKDSKDSRSQKISRAGTFNPNSSSMDEENNRKKVQSGSETKKSQLLLNKNSLLDDSYASNKSLKKELLNRNSPLDISYFTEYGSNLSLKKYVAKKTVQEQAFRISDIAKSSPEIKKPAPAAPVISTSETLFGKDGKEDAKSQPPKASGLFANASGTSDLLKNVVSSSADSKPTTQAAPSLEKKESTLAQPSSEQSPPKSGALFGNLGSMTTSQEKKPEPAPAGDTNKAPETKSSSSLFTGGGTSGLFGPTTGEKPSSSGLGLFGNTPATITTPAEEPKLTKADSTVTAPAAEKTTSVGLSIGSGGLFSTIKPGGAAPSKPLTASDKPAEVAQPATSITSSLFTQNATEQKPAETKPEEKKSMFGGLEGLSSLKKPEDNKKPGGGEMFAGLGSAFSKPAPPAAPHGSGATEAPKEEKKPTLFANLASTPSSGGLFGNTAGQASTSGNGMNDDSKKSDLSSLGSNQQKSPFGSGGNLLNQIQSGSMNQQGSFLANLSPQKDENKAPSAEAPKTGGLLFGNLAPSANTGSTSSLFGQQNQSSPTKPAEPAAKPGIFSGLTANTGGTNATSGGSGLFSGILGSGAGTTTGSATGGMFGNNAGGETKPGGLFGNLNGGSATGTSGATAGLFSGGLFSNK